MRMKQEITQQDLDLCEKVKRFLEDHGNKGAYVTCDKDDICRVKDFCIEVKNTSWFETDWYNCNSHLTKSTVLQLNRLLELLRTYSKELGICNITRRVYGIIFDARKRG